MLLTVSPTESLCSLLRIPGQCQTPQPLRPLGQVALVMTRGAERPLALPHHLVPAAPGATHPMPTCGQQLLQLGSKRASPRTRSHLKTTAAPLYVDLSYVPPNPIQNFPQAQAQPVRAAPPKAVDTSAADEVANRLYYQVMPPCDHILTCIQRYQRTIPSS